MSSSTANSPKRPRGRSPSNRSLERGVEVLRAFRPGSELLGNGDLAERTGIPKSTVSRLTQTLVTMGLLQLDSAQRAYRLAPAVLGVAHAMRSGSTVLSVAAPLMRALAERERINVGLAAPDRDEMVYLESIRYNRRVALRNVVSGQRVPMELTSLGRAYLATVSDDERKVLYAHFKDRRGKHWPAIRAEIETCRAQVRQEGHCSTSWQPEVVAVATPLQLRDTTYVLNLSLSTADAVDAVVSRLAPKLLVLLQQIQTKLEGDSPRA